MRKIGFIDIYPQGEEWQDNAFIYIFKDSSGEFELEETKEYSSAEITADIAEFYLNIPLESLNFRIINLPTSDKEKLRKIMPLELETLTIGNPQELVFETVILNDTGSGFDVLVVYTDKSALNAVLRELALKNIDPRTITSTDIREIIHAGAGGAIAGGAIAGRLANLEMPLEFDRVKAAAEELAAPTINLRIGPLAYTKDIDRRKRAFRKTAILCLLLAVVINADIVFNLAMTKKEVSSQKGEIRNVYTALFPAEKKIVDELYQLKSHLKEMREKRDAMTGVAPLRLLLSLSQKPSEGVIYNEIRIEEGLIKMKAEATSMGAVDRMRKSLPEYLSDISVSDVKPAPNGRVFFNVAAKEKQR